MSFSDEVVKVAWQRSGGVCECTNPEHQHSKRCRTELKWFRRGIEIHGGWEAHHMTPYEDNGTDDIENCFIFCMDCHRNNVFAEYQDQDMDVDMDLDMDTVA